MQMPGLGCKFKFHIEYFQLFSQVVIFNTLQSVQVVNMNMDES